MSKHDRGWQIEEEKDSDRLTDTQIFSSGSSCHLDMSMIRRGQHTAERDSSSHSFWQSQGPVVITCGDTGLDSGSGKIYW